MTVAMGLLSRAATTLGLLTAAGLLAVPATALAQSPPPGGQGVSVIPAPGERTASGSGTHLELGTLTPGVAATVKVVVRDVGPGPGRLGVPGGLLPQ